MTSLSPVSTAVLNAELLNADDESVLRINGESQTLTLELKNQSAQPVELGGSSPTTIVVTFRPGALESYSGIKIAGDGWSGGVETSATELVPVTITRTTRLSLAKDGVERITLTGLKPSGHGGSRNTRVDVEFRDVHLPGEGPVSGRRLAHLSLLHEQVSEASVAGGSATSGPFEASIENGAQIVNGGTENLVIARLSTSRPVPVTTPKKAGIVDDEVSRFEFEFKVESGDLFTIVGVSPINGGGWSEDGMAINYSQVKAKTLDGDFARLAFKFTTNLPPGIYPLRLKYFNFGKLDGTLTLLVQVTAIGVPGAEQKGGDIVASKGITAAGTVKAPEYRFGRWRVQDNENNTSNWISFRRDKNQYSSFWFVHPKDSSGNDLKIAEIAGGAPGQSLNIKSRSNKLGINNRNPTVALDVSGDIKASGKLSVPQAELSGGILQMNNKWRLDSPTAHWEIRNGTRQTKALLALSTKGNLSVSGDIDAKSLTVKSLSVNGQVKARSLELSNYKCIEFPGGWNFYITGEGFYIQKNAVNLFKISANGDTSHVSRRLNKKLIWLD